ncbi:enolase C-terminal domain-like protein [Streptomyces erythrochromogenes]|uniref:enolase C-terminal domain-like protein n=1 Tax=Streptomyces erythrochromogenes TaxID=285574 RepID=UPI00368BB217
MRHLVIDSFDFADLADHAGPGDDTVFVAVRSGRAAGWYGPLTDPVARTIRALAALLVGADVTDHEGIQDRLAQAAPRSRAGSWAVGALDCAAWDLHAQAEGCPAARLLTGEPLQHRITAYSSWLTRDLAHPATADLISEVSAQGWVFTKWRLRNRPGTSGEALADALHAAATAEPIAVDAVGTWPPALTTEFAAAADPAALVWLEDPAPTDDLRAYEQLRTLPLAVGERLTLADDAPAVLAGIRPAALTLDVVGCGGLTTTRRILARTTTPVFPHGRSLMPSLHLAAARPDQVLAVEYRQQWEPGRQHLYAHPIEPDRGHLTLPTAPCLGAAPRSAPC